MKRHSLETLEFVLFTWQLVGHYNIPNCIASIISIQLWRTGAKYSIVVYSFLEIVTFRFDIPERKNQIEVEHVVRSLNRDWQELGEA
jgi:hypothetical protein